MRSRRSTSWRAAKVTFVAIRRVGVGPEVKMDSQRLGRKSAILLVVERCVWPFL